MTRTPTMTVRSRTVCPTVLLRISDGPYHAHRAFSDFGQAMQSAEAYAGAGYCVAMMSATGRFLMDFEPRDRRTAI